MANIVKFYYFQNQNEYNTFLSSNTVDSAALYVIGAEGLLYRGNELIAENSLNLIQALNEINQTQNNAIETNSKNIESLDELIATLQQEQLELEESLKNKVEVVTGKGLSTNDYTTAEKNKLAGIEEEANKTVIDTNLSSTSTNPVQNKVIYSALGNKVDKSITINGKSLSGNIVLGVEDINGVASDEELTAHNNDAAAHPQIKDLIDTQAESISDVSDNLGQHVGNTAIHVTQADKDKWNSIKSAFDTVKVGDTELTPEGHSGNIEFIAGNGIQLSMTKNATDAEITINNLVSEISVETGTANGTISVNGEDVKVKGLGSAAYTNSTAYATPASIEQVLTDSNQYTDNAVSTHASNTTLHTSMTEKNLWNTVEDKVDKVSGKGLSTNDYTTTEKNKLAGIASGAEVNQNAFSNIKIGDTTVSADSKTDTLTLVAGSNITLTPDTTNDKVTISATNTTYEAAGSALGLVKSGGDVSISSGVITVNDDSHYHIISNVDGLQSALDAKVPTARTINKKALTANISLTASDVGADPSGAASGVQSNLDTHIADTDLHFTTAEKTKLSGIETGAQVNTVTGVKGNSETSYRTGEINITKANIGLSNVNNTSDANKPVSTAQQTAIDSALATANAYTDEKINAIVGDGANESLDTIAEISAALNNNPDIITTLNNAIGNKVDKVSGKGLSTNDYTTTEKTKLSGIATGAEVNQNAFSNIKIGTTTISADSKTDTLTLSAGNGISLTPTASSDTISIANTGVLSIGTGTSNGTISVDGENVAVKGLGSAAYKASSAFDAAGAANTAASTAETNAKAHADEIKTTLEESLNTLETDLSEDITNIINGTTTVKKAESATTATKVGTTTVGGSTQPIYLNNGTPTKIGYTIAKSVPSNAVFTDTTYTAGTGLALSGTTFNHSNSVTAATVKPSVPSSLPTSGTVNLNFGGGLTIPHLTYDATGHITGKSSTTFVLPSETGVSYALNPTTSDSQNLGYGAEITVQNPTGVSGQKTTFSNIKYKLPEAQVLALSDTTNSKTVASGGTFTAVSAISVTDDENDYTLNTTTTTYTIPSLSEGTAGTASATLSHGGTFTAVSDVAVSGHTVTQTNKTFTLPSETSISIASGGGNTASDATVVGGLSASKHAITATKKTLVAGDNVTIAASSNNITISATSTDTKVKQGSSTTASYRSLLMGSNTLSASTTAPSEVTNQVYAATGIAAQPSTGTIRVSKLNIGDGAFLSWDSTNQALVISFA
mgnify:CR=1 FL=1